MSDFFYKEKFGPMFSPVIKIKRENIPPTVVSAIDHLLSPTGNMFTRAETVKRLMKIENMNLDMTAKALSLKRSDVAGKLRLLEFSKPEREAVLEYGFSEQSALQFLKLDKTSRFYAIEYCHKSGYDAEGIEQYVNSMVNSRTKKKDKAETSENTSAGIRKIAVSDVRFLINSIENAVRLAGEAGFEVERQVIEDNDGYDINIRVNIKDKNRK